MTRVCSSCQKDLPKSNYSKNQWAKKSKAKCKSCVAIGAEGSDSLATPAAPTSTVEEYEEQLIDSTVLAVEEVIPEGEQEQEGGEQEDSVEPTITTPTDFQVDSPVENKELPDTQKDDNMADDEEAIKMAAE